MKNFKEFQESTRLSRETGTLVKGGTKYKPKSQDKVMDAVKKSIYASGGKIMRSGSNQPKKVKGAKTDGEGKYTKMLNQKKDNQAYADRAKKAGFKSTQDYTNTVARYGGEKNYNNPNKHGGLGT